MAAVQARITEELARLVAPARLPVGPPAAYVRRHLLEHAAADNVLDERVVTPEFLPFADIGRLREVSGRASLRTSHVSGLLTACRRVGYA
ncbi:hypothetical protein ACIHFD_64935 [Nonomuraea sp. NPDC051941]|uniref:hypothetical protein n=1 Tax=Nonomuraea sp. NPDC051941 TaxID=3364373 RepID=UPI0037CB178A